MNTTLKTLESMNNYMNINKNSCHNYMSDNCINSHKNSCNKYMFDSINEWRIIPIELLNIKYNNILSDTKFNDIIKEECNNYIENDELGADSILNDRTLD